MKLWEAALTRGPELHGAASPRVRPSLPIMFLRSSVSRLLYGQIPCVLTRSVHSVAIVGAPFSRGQVRAATRADGTRSLESFVGPGEGEGKNVGKSLRVLMAGTWSARGIFSDLDGDEGLMDGKG